MDFGYIENLNEFIDIFVCSDMVAEYTYTDKDPAVISLNIIFQLDSQSFVLSRTFFKRT